MNLLKFGDVACLLLFVVLGNISHNSTQRLMRSLLETGLPIVAIWLLAAPWFGVYRKFSWRNWIPVWLLSVLFGSITRFIVLGKPFNLSFLIFTTIGLVFTLALLGLWRLLYSKLKRAG